MSVSNSNIYAYSTKMKILPLAGTTFSAISEEVVFFRRRLFFNESLDFLLPLVDEGVVLVLLPAMMVPIFNVFQSQPLDTARRSSRMTGITVLQPEGQVKALWARLT